MGNRALIVVALVSVLAMAVSLHARPLRHRCHWPVGLRLAAAEKNS